MANEIVMRMAIVLLVMAKWMVHGLIQWSTWVCDCLVCEMKGGVLTAKEEFLKGCDCEREMATTVDCATDAIVYMRDSLSSDPQREGVTVVIAGHPDLVSEPDDGGDDGREAHGSARVNVTERERDGTSRVGNGNNEEGHE